MSPDLTPTEAATYLGIRPSTLAKWRMSPDAGPKFIKYGRTILYPQVELDAFKQSRLFSSTKELWK